MAAPDVLLAILMQMQEQHPSSSFINSLYNQYCNRGGLSKKQLEGLLDKMKKTTGMPAAKIATVEAIILKKPTRERAKPTISALPIVKDESSGNMMNDILANYPQHKRILFLKSRFDKNEAISLTETAEIKRLHTLLIK
jgi:hypothetical protein